jgi:hypothetical protein
MATQHNLRYAFRGPELAFAIPWGDFAALEEVADLACDFWNGANSLIVAVGSDGDVPDMDLLLRICEVERVYVHDRVGDAGRAALTARFGSRLRSPWAYGLEREQHPLNLQPSFRTADSAGPLPVLLLPAYEDEALRRIARIAFGRIKDEDWEDYGTAFSLEFCAGQEAHFALVDGQVSGLAPLAQSTNLMWAYEQSSPLDVRHVMVVDGTDFQALVNFWNLRARTTQHDGVTSVVAVPTEALGAVEELSSLRDWTSSGRAVKPDMFVLVDERHRTAAASAFAALGYVPLPPGAAEFTVYIGHVASDRETPEYVFTDAFRLGGHMRRGAPTDQLINLDAGQRNAVTFEPRGVTTAHAGRTVTLDLVSWPLPFVPTEATARRVHRDASVYDGTVCLRTVAMNAPYLFDLVVPGADDALADFLAARGLSQEPSPAGRYAQALVRRVGGPQRLESLANGAALKVLEPLTPPSRKKLVQRLHRMLAETYGENAPSHGEIFDAIRAHVIALELPHLELQGLASVAEADVHMVLDTLEPLVEAGFVLRGRTERCPECGYEAFHSLGEVAERVTCQACRLQFLLPVKRAGERGSEEPPLSYQLDPLMARAMDQDLLPVLLTLRYLSTPQGSSTTGAFWPGLVLFEPGRREETERDCDVLVAQSGRVTICECKKTAHNLTPRQTAQVLEVAKRLDAAAVFSAVEGEFSAEVIALGTDQNVRFVTKEQLVP